MKSAKILTLLFVISYFFVASQTYFLLGKKSFNQENYTDADYWLNKSLDSQTESKFESLILLSISNGKQNDLSKCELYLLKAITFNPRTHLSYYNISLAYIYLKNYKLSLNYCDSSLILNKEDAHSLSHKALILNSNGNYLEAIDYEKKALAIIPDNINFKNNMGWHYLCAKNYDTAIQIYNELIAVDSLNAKAFANRSLCFQGKKDYERSVVDIDKAISLKPLSIQFIIQKGELRLKENKICWACANFEDLKSMSDTAYEKYISKYCSDRDAINYFENGKIAERVKYVGNKREGKHIGWFENGNISIEAMFKDGNREGIAKQYFEDGTLMKELFFKYDLQDGPAKEYYQNGKLKQKLFYKSGFLDSLAITYYESGKIHQIATYKNSNIDGEYKVYYPNGKLKEQGAYTNGQMFTKPKVWDEKGNEIEWESR